MLFLLSILMQRTILRVLAIFTSGSNQSAAYLKDEGKVPWSHFIDYNQYSIPIFLRRCHVLKLN